MAGSLIPKHAPGGPNNFALQLFASPLPAQVNTNTLVTLWMSTHSYLGGITMSTPVLLVPVAAKNTITNVLKAAESASRVALKSVTTVERLVDGVDALIQGGEQITTLMLKQQHDRLLAEFGETPTQSTEA